MGTASIAGKPAAKRGRPCCCERGGCVDNPVVPLISGQIKSQASPTNGEVQRILRLKVPVIVKLAERRLMLSEVMRLGVGAILEFSKSSDEPLELLINNKPIGIGEAVKVGENFGLRITQVGDMKQIVAAMGK